MKEVFRKRERGNIYKEISMDGEREVSSDFMTERTEIYRFRQMGRE